MQRILYITLLLILTASPDLSAQDIVYPNGAKAAVSLTFDDGLLEHYTIVWPLLQELGLRGTFWIPAGHIDKHKVVRDAEPMTWEQIAEMSAQGQEIANHGFSHRNLTDLTAQQAMREILRGDSAICAHIGVHTTAFAYPGNRKNDTLNHVVDSLGFYARTVQQSFGGKRVATDEDFSGWIQKVIRSGKWAVTMTHAIALGYDAFPEPAAFERHLRRLAALQQEGKIWIAPFSEVAAYIEEQTNKQ